MRDRAPDLLVVDPRIGDTLTCPGCHELLKLDGSDGWTNRNGFTCNPTNTTHSDHIMTVMTGGTE
jgi:hypothetical protein